MEDSSLAEIIKIEIPRILNTIKRKEIVIVNEVATKILLIQSIKSTLSLIINLREKTALTNEQISFKEFRECMGGMLIEYSYLIMTVNNYQISFDLFQTIYEEDVSKMAKRFYENPSKSKLAIDLHDLISDEMISISEIAFSL